MKCLITKGALRVSVMLIDRKINATKIAFNSGSSNLMNRNCVFLVETWVKCVESNMSVELLMT